MNYYTLPEGWKIKSMTEVAKWSSGGTPKSTIKEYYDGDIPWFIIGDLNNGLVIKTEKSITKLGLENSNAKIIPVGTLLVGMYGSIGKLGITGIECCTNQAIAFAKELYDVKCKWLYYYFQLIKSELFQMGKGGTQKNISLTVLNSLEVPIPPISVQERIVAKIEELFSELDKGVEVLQKTKAQLKVYHQAVLKNAYTLEKTKKSSLKECCCFITKGTTPQKSEMLTNDGDIPFIKVYNLTFTGYLDFSIDPTFVSTETHIGFLKRSIVIPNDVLMNIVGPPLGKVSIVPDIYPEWNINQAIARFRCLETLNCKYLAYYLMFLKTVETMKRKAKATAGQFNLTLEICRNIKIPLPCIERQLEIITEIESRLSICDKIEQTVDEALLKAESLRQSILKRAFEGRLI